MSKFVCTCPYRYGYAYFDFDEEQVYIDADDIEERVISFQKAFKEIYS